MEFKEKKDKKEKEKIRRDMTWMICRTMNRGFCVFDDFGKPSYWTPFPFVAYRGLSLLGRFPW